MAAVYYNQATNTRNTADTRQAAAVANAKVQQKADDDAAYTTAAESPYRTYTAPVASGSFQVAFPKTWSSYVEEQPNGMQVFLRLNPDFVRRTDGTADKDAVHVSLMDQSSTAFIAGFDTAVKRGEITKTVITVSGVPGYDLTGTFSDKRTLREVVIPVRDKIIVFATENSRYSSEFSQILAQAKINP
jgi:hypothetical protein